MGTKAKGHVSFYVLESKIGKFRMHSQVLSMSSKSGHKRTYVWAKAKQTCVLLTIKAREGNSECIGKFHQSPETKKKVICRSASSVEART